MSAGTSSEWVVRLGDAVRARREQQGLPVDLTARGGPSEMTIRKIEGYGFDDGADLVIRPMTKRRLEDALAWPRGWVDAIVSGEVESVEAAIAPISLRSARPAQPTEPDPREPVLGTISAAEFAVRRLAQTEVVESAVADRTAGLLREAWRALADAPGGAG